MVGGRAHKIRAMLEQAKWDIYPGMEATWTLMAFSTYLGLNESWQNKHGEDWTLERIVGAEAGEIKVNGNRVNAGESACGGSHRLFGLSVALNRYLKETQLEVNELKGGWRAANDVLEAAKKKRASFSSRTARSRCIILSGRARPARLRSGSARRGHLFEVMATCMTKKELERRGWSRRAISSVRCSSRPSRSSWSAGVCITPRTGYLCIARGGGGCQGKRRARRPARRSRGAPPFLRSERLDGRHDQ